MWTCQNEVFTFAMKRKKSSQPPPDYFSDETIHSDQEIKEDLQIRNSNIIV